MVQELWPVGFLSFQPAVSLPLNKGLKPSSFCAAAEVITAVTRTTAKVRNVNLTFIKSSYSTRLMIASQQLVPGESPPRINVPCLGSSWLRVATCLPLPNTTTSILSSPWVLTSSWHFSLNGTLLAPVGGTVNLT